MTTITSSRLLVRTNAPPPKTRSNKRSASNSHMRDCLSIGKSTRIVGCTDRLAVIESAAGLSPKSQGASCGNRCEDDEFPHSESGGVLQASTARLKHDGQRMHGALRETTTPLRSACDSATETRERGTGLHDLMRELAAKVVGPCIPGSSGVRQVLTVRVVLRFALLGLAALVGLIRQGRRS